MKPKKEKSIIPRKPPSSCRTSNLTIRLTVEEKIRLVEAAAKAELTITDYLVRRALKIG